MENVLTTMRVLEAVADHQPVGVSELSRVTQVPKTTVQRSLPGYPASWSTGLPRPHGP